MFLELDMWLEGACVTIPAFVVEPNGMTSQARRDEIIMLTHLSFLVRIRYSVK